MKQSCTSTFRRGAAIGAAVAIVAASSAFGIGATAAVAAPAETTAAGASPDATPTNQPATDATPSPAHDGNGEDVGSSAPAPAAAPEPDAPATPDDTASEPPAAAASDAPAGAADQAAPTPQTGAAPAEAEGRADAAASTPVTWSDASSPEDRIVLTATAGSQFSHTFTANGGDGPLEYLFNPRTDPGGLRWDEETGVLSGTLPETAGVLDIDVAATDLHQSATQWVRIEVQPAAATHIGAQVYSNEAGRNPSWSVGGGPDGGVAPIGGGGLIDAVPVEPGGSLWTSAVVTDRFGNPSNGPEMPSESTLTSSDPADVLTWNADTNTWKATFGDAGRRTLTMRSEGLTLSIPVAVDDAPLAFTGSGATQIFRTTAGESFSHTFSTTGSSDPVRYVLQYPDDEYVDPEHADARIPDHLTLDRETGVLSGTPTVAGEYRFRVVATDGSEIARQEVRFTVDPGATKSILTFVSTGEDGKGTVWGFGPGKQLIRIDGLGEAATHTPVDAIPVDQGDALFVKSTPIDAWGNTSVPLEPQAGDPHPEVTSSVATDRIDFLERSWSSRVTFTHASLHRIAVRFDGVSDTFDVAVTPTAAGTGAGAGGSLAYTGADETGPLAWALGLLAAGGGLLTHRLRRRRS